MQQPKIVAVLETKLVLSIGQCDSQPCIDHAAATDMQGTKPTVYVDRF
jgi:SH3-like domain-containing protein